MANESPIRAPVFFQQGEELVTMLHLDPRMLEGRRDQHDAGDHVECRADELIDLGLGPSGRG